METRVPISHDDSVGEVMAARPATIRVFLDFGMGCIGCPISGFHTVDEACKEHGVSSSEFLAALRAAATTVTA
jgi:hybrid cluster-associated redox disulfide protein